MHIMKAHKNTIKNEKKNKPHINGNRAPPKASIANPDRPRNKGGKTSASHGRRQTHAARSRNQPTRETTVQRMTCVIHHTSQPRNQQTSASVPQILPRLTDHPSCLVHNPVHFVPAPPTNAPTPTQQTTPPNTSNDRPAKQSKNPPVNMKTTQPPETAHPDAEPPDETTNAITPCKPTVHHDAKTPARRHAADPATPQNDGARGRTGNPEANNHLPRSRHAQFKKIGITMADKHRKPLPTDGTITVPNQTNHSSIISKFNKRTRRLTRSAIRSTQGKQKWSKNCTLRSTSVGLETVGQCSSTCHSHTPRTISQIVQNPGQNRPEQARPEQNPSALVMNLTQIVVENDCIWGQSDYSRSQNNDSFWVIK